MTMPLVLANWKMNGNTNDNYKLVKALESQFSSNTNIEIGIFPPFPYLHQLRKLLGSCGVHLGAQNLSFAREGAFTGEVSARMLAEFNCRYVLVGHSERRKLFKESNDQVAEKFEATVNAELKPVLCVGETLTQRQQGETESVVISQIQAVLDRTGITGFSNAVIAYEPVWAIGTGETATPEQAQAVHANIRQFLSGFSAEIANAVQIVYGGSVKANNASALFSQKDVDGGLVGGASLNAGEFIEVCEAARCRT